MKNRLTKTAYLNYLKCPQEFWMDHNGLRESADVFETLEYEHLRQQGYAVQQLVKQLRRFRTGGTAVIDFERAFTTDELYARSDLVVTNTDTGIIDIYEVKSSASVKDEHLDDVAFQKMVAKQSGSSVGRCHVITMNGEYVRQGELDVEQLFTITDVTDEIEVRNEATIQQTAEAIAYIDSTPIPSLVDYCMENKLDCRFIRLHFPDLPGYTIFDISRLNNDRRRLLLADGIIDVKDVPDDFKLSKKQQAQVIAAKSNSIEIDREGIAERIASWEYPLHFLDYETFSYAIPQFDGVRPFQQMCFQYSLHTIASTGAEMTHSKFLSRGDDDPPRALAEKLYYDLANNLGTVLVWYEGFEKTRNTEMAGMFPEYATFFEELNAHTQDLMKVFSDNLYIHPEFRGRTSIKKVLPVLRPNLSYTDLGIGDGMTASISWFRAATWETLKAAEREKIFDDLDNYCKLDTLAMVEIYSELASLNAEY